MRRWAPLALAYFAGAATAVAAFVVVTALDDDPVPGAAVAGVPEALFVEPTARSTDAYAGLGTWVDVFDWSPSYTNGEPPVAPTAVEEMAAAGVRTLFLQAARNDPRSPDGLVDPPLLAEWLVRAHRAGLRVVGWYLPRYVDLAADHERLSAVRDLEILGHRFDGVAVDIEPTEGVGDPTERSQRLVQMSRRFATESGDLPLGAIVLPPVQLEVINEQLWPQFPWRDLAPLYDVWLPMSYWTFRSEESGYLDGYAYNEESTRRLRRNLGDNSATVHGIGGIGDLATAEDLTAFERSLSDTRSIGGSIYDWNTLDAAKRALLDELLGE